jgi:hypothetical protein
MNIIRRGIFRRRFIRSEECFENEECFKRRMFRAKNLPPYRKKILGEELVDEEHSDEEYSEEELT